MADRVSQEYEEKIQSLKAKRAKLLLEVETIQSFELKRTDKPKKSEKEQRLEAYYKQQLESHRNKLDKEVKDDNELIDKIKDKLQSDIEKLTRQANERIEKIEKRIEKTKKDEDKQLWVKETEEKLAALLTKEEQDEFHNNKILYKKQEELKTLERELKDIEIHSAKWTACVNQDTLDLLGLPLLNKSIREEKKTLEKIDKDEYERELYESRKAREALEKKEHDDWWNSMTPKEQQDYKKEQLEHLKHRAWLAAGQKEDSDETGQKWTYKLTDNNTSFELIKRENKKPIEEKPEPIVEVVPSEEPIQKAPKRVFKKKLNKQSEIPATNILIPLSEPTQQPEEKLTIEEQRENYSKGLLELEELRKKANASLEEEKRTAIQAAEEASKQSYHEEELRYSYKNIKDEEESEEERFYRSCSEGSSDSECDESDETDSTLSTCSQCNKVVCSRSCPNHKSNRKPTDSFKLEMNKIRALVS